jgi:hypothetical protein
MKPRILAGIGLSLVVTLATHSLVAGQTSRPYAPPRTPWGDPDLQGTYSNSNESGIPMERPPELSGKRLEEVTQVDLGKLIDQRSAALRQLARTIGGSADNDTGAGPPHWYENYDARNSRPWLIVDPPDGRIPTLTADAQTRATALMEARRGRGEADSAEDRSLYDRCITRGVPGSMMPAIYGNSYQIIQSPGHVAIRYEMIHETRLIPLDRHQHAGPNVRLYMGDPRGRWEGDTLVVETTNFNGRNAADIVGYGSPDRGASQNLKIVERFTRIGPTTVEWSVTLDDARTWVRPWTFAMHLTRDNSQPVFEYACHEGNYGLMNILSAARAEDKHAER